MRACIGFQTVRAALLLATAAACAVPARSSAQVEPKGATAQTAGANAALLTQLPFSNRRDYEDAQRGYIATLPNIDITSADGRTVWQLKSYDFLKQADAPPTVNPSLWRNAQLNLFNGLFKVVDGIYQIRGFDLSNMTIIEGNSGIIVVDPLISEEVAKAGLELYYAYRPQKPVRAVIYTHSHVDHYGGVRGVVREADVKAGRVKIYAPEGFLAEAVNENVFAGNAMSRRALYMYGALLPKGDKGQVDGGLGKTTSTGTVGLIAPTDTITKTGETRTIDGLGLIFQMAPGTEAPSEMLFYVPRYKALCTAEDATHTLHNLYTIRGAQVRDANKWWQALNTTLALFGARTEVAFASHHWPTWGNQNVVAFLKKQRDLYKYLHDQALQLLNAGYTITEIGEMVQLPPSLANEWYNRGYYGTVNHDSKAVYQRYMGWYTGNPADLYPLPPVEAATKYVEYMGGSAAVIRKARESFTKGEYRWVAQVMNQVVFAEPENSAARELEADALEQLGYQAEAGTWRNAFLMGAFELRNGVPKLPAIETASADTIRAMTPEMVLQYMGMRLDAQKAAGKQIAINWNVPDLKKTYAIEIDNSVLMYTEGKQLKDADATVSMPKNSLSEIQLGTTTLDGEVATGRVKIAGNKAKVDEMLGLLVKFDPLFNIVTP